MSADSMIARRPPDDGQEWDAQCARCGSSTGRVQCGACGGCGWIDDGGAWDDLADEEGEAAVRCEACGGAGGWRRCLSDAPWCEAHPLAGRADVERGAVEWFAVGSAEGDV